ncbi:hypothetical protein BLNAU_23389 [Blattamonas nauphoetae]|uniref:Uncharacterized protein n=1 Tax=Blattamonas nauphoetae TaxID=2049346 RepID=A0ABQ9WQD8_9EUKA|nr:hypothetical protein BLNAU_23389 [Blattamonas nauphoetae]
MWMSFRAFWTSCANTVFLSLFHIHSHLFHRSQRILSTIPCKCGKQYILDKPQSNETSFLCLSRTYCTRMNAVWSISQLWTKPPSIPSVDQLSILLLAISPVLRDCHVTCGDISSHPSIIIQTHSIAHQVFSVLTSNRLEPMQSKTVCCAVFLLFSRCTEPTQASEYELLFKTQTGLETEDMDTLCNASLNQSFLQLPCFTAISFGNDDLTFVGCALRILEHHQQISKSTVLNEQEGEAKEFENIDSSMMLCTFELNLLFVCTLLSLPSSTFDTISLTHPTEEVSNKEDVDENNTIQEEEGRDEDEEEIETEEKDEKEEKEKAEENEEKEEEAENEDEDDEEEVAYDWTRKEEEKGNPFRNLLVDSLSLPLGFTFWEALGNVNTPDFSLQIESSAMLLSHPTLLPLLPLVKYKLGVFTWSFEDYGGFRKNITPSMLVSFVRGMCHEGTAISDELATALADIMHRVFFGPWFSNAEQEHRPQNRQLLPTATHFVKELYETKDDSQRRRNVVCLWALGTCSDGRQFEGTGVSIALAEILSSGVDDRLALFILRFFASAFNLSNIAWSERTSTVFLAAVPPIIKYAQHVDFPLLSKLAWDAIHMLITNYDPGSSKEKADDVVNALFNDVVRMLPRTIELFADSLRTCSGDTEDNEKKAVLIALAAGVMMLGRRTHSPIFTPLLLSLFPLLVDLPDELVQGNFTRNIYLHSCGYNNNAFSVDIHMPTPPFIQTTTTSLAPDAHVHALAHARLHRVLFGESRLYSEVDVVGGIFDEIDRDSHRSVLLHMLSLIPSTLFERGETQNEGIRLDRGLAQNVAMFFYDLIEESTLSNFPLLQLAARLSLEFLRHHVAPFVKESSSWRVLLPILTSADVPPTAFPASLTSADPQSVLPALALVAAPMLESNPNVDLTFTDMQRRTHERRTRRPRLVPSCPNRAPSELTNTVDEWTRLLVEEGVEDVAVFLTGLDMDRVGQVMGMNHVQDQYFVFPPEPVNQVLQDADGDNDDNDDDSDPLNYDLSGLPKSQTQVVEGRFPSGSLIDVANSTTTLSHFWFNPTISRSLRVQALSFCSLDKSIVTFSSSSLSNMVVSEDGPLFVSTEVSNVTLLNMNIANISTSSSLFRRSISERPGNVSIVGTCMKDSQNVLTGGLVPGMSLFSSYFVANTSITGCLTNADSTTENNPSMSHQALTASHTFINCTWTATTSTAHGGAINADNKGSLSVSSCTFLKCNCTTQAYVSGGAVFFEGSLTHSFFLNTSVFDQCYSVSRAGAAALRHMGKMSISLSNCSHSRADNSIPTFHIIGAPESSILSNLRFEHASTVSWGNSGAIDFDTIYSDIMHSNILFNSNSAGQGGAVVYSETSGTPVINWFSCIFFNNKATRVKPISDDPTTTCVAGNDLYFYCERKDWNDTLARSGAFTNCFSTSEQPRVVINTNSVGTHHTIYYPTNDTLLSVIFPTPSLIVSVRTEASDEDGCGINYLVPCRTLGYVGVNHLSSSTGEVLVEAGLFTETTGFTLSSKSVTITSFGNENPTVCGEARGNRTSHHQSCSFFGGESGDEIDSDLISTSTGPLSVTNTRFSSLKVGTGALLRWDTAGSVSLTDLFFLNLETTQPAPFTISTAASLSLAGLYFEKCVGSSFSDLLVDPTVLPQISGIPSSFSTSASPRASQKDGQELTQKPSYQIPVDGGVGLDEPFCWIPTKKCRSVGRLVDRLGSNFEGEILVTVGESIETGIALVQTQSLGVTGASHTDSIIQLKTSTNSLLLVPSTSTLSLLSLTLTLPSSQTSSPVISSSGTLSITSVTFALSSQHTDLSTSIISRVYSCLTLYTRT